MENDDIKKVLWNNEIKANRLASGVVALFAINCLIIFIQEPKTFYVYNEYFRYIYLVVFVLGTIISLICEIFKGSRKWIKYMLEIYLVISVALISTSADTGIVALFLCIPPIISCRYYSEGFTISMCITTVVMIILIPAVISIFNLSTMPNLNYVVMKAGLKKEVSGQLFDKIKYPDVDMGRYLYGIAIGLIIPALLVLIMICFLCIMISRAGKKMLIEQTNTIRINEKINTELNYARDIQKDIVHKEPLISKNIDILGDTNPARSVGGDLYDFFKIDDTHVAFAIGDVSDKGVPAALFMSRCFTAIDGYTRDGFSVDKVFNYTNKALCYNNNSSMFVTAFIGILDLETGELECANAGHGVPIIIDSNGCRYERVEPDLFLGGMEDSQYTLHKYKLEKGSRIVLYTDGVTEALDKNDVLYGEERFIEYLSNHINDSQSNLLEGIHEDIKRFVGDCEQADDITLLFVDYH